MCSARERFLAVLGSGPLLRGDAIIALSGDGTVRLDTALAVFAQGGAPLIVVSGGLDNPPHSLTAEDSRNYLIEHGVAPDRIILEGASQNTHEGAEAVVEMAHDREWNSLLLVTSPYHMPRTYLTFLAELKRAGSDIKLIPVPAAQAKWWKSPEGLEDTRLELMAGEFTKIDSYSKFSDVASYEDGLAHLEQWEAA